MLRILIEIEMKKHIKIFKKTIELKDYDSAVKLLGVWLNLWHYDEKDLNHFKIRDDKKQEYLELYNRADKVRQKFRKKLID